MAQESNHLDDYKKTIKDASEEMSIQHQDAAT